MITCWKCGKTASHKTRQGLPVCQIHKTKDDEKLRSYSTDHTKPKKDGSSMYIGIRKRDGNGSSISIQPSGSMKLENDDDETTKED